jgi:hypothetical protein
MALPFAAVCHTRNQVSSRDGGTNREARVASLAICTKHYDVPQ